MAVIFKFRFPENEKDIKMSLANTELLDLANDRALLFDGGFSLSQDDNGCYLQVEGGAILLRAIAAAISATAQELIDLEILLG